MKNTDFPLLNAAVEASKSPWGQKSLGTVVTTINTYTDSIPNPAFKSAKEALNTVVDLVRSFQGPYSETFSAAYKFENAKYQLDFMYANQVAGKVKLATKKNFENAEWFAICAEIVVLYNALMTLKDKIVKRVGRSEEEKADDYVPPMPTTAAAMKVLGILKTMTDDLTKQYAEILFNGYVSSVQYRMDHPRVRGERSMPTHADFLLQTVGGEWNSSTGNYTTLVPNFRDLLRTMADKDADYAQRMFLYKNVTKLAVIIEGKANFTTHKIIEGIVNGAGFQGEIVFNFADKTSFTVRNKVIVNVSVHGKAFNQYPTTFHNVTGLTGQPSQEDMIESFAGVKA